MASADLTFHGVTSGRADGGGVRHIETGVLVTAGFLRYVHVEQPHYYDDHRDRFTTEAPQAMQDAVRAMVFDQSECTVCADGIGPCLDMDPETTADVPVFREFYVAQVGDGPVALLCEDCAQPVVALAPEPTR